ncbi:MAG: oligosaccharide flippase family protein [Gemmatimonadota bacterium]
MKGKEARRVSGSSSASIADTIGRKATLAIGVSSIGYGVAFVGSIVVARLLGAEGKGSFSLFLVTVSGLTTLAGFGLEKGHMFHASRSEERLERFLSNGIMVSLLLGGGSGILYFLLGQFADLSITSMGMHVAIAAIVMVSILTMLKFQTQYLLMIHAFVLSRANRSLQQAIPLVAALALLPIMEPTVDRLILAVVTGMFALLIVTQVLMRRLSPIRVRLSPALFSFSFLRESLGFGLRVYLGDVLLFFAKRLDFFLVALLLGRSALGIYSVAVALSEVAVRIPRELGMMLFPVFASGGLRTGQAASLLRKMNAVALGLALTLGVLAKFLIELLFGEEFAPAASVFQWLLPGTVAWSTVQVTYNRVAAGGRPGLGVFVFGGAVVIDAVLNVILLPRIGVAGAAIAATASYLFAAAALLHFFCRYEGSSYKEALVPRMDDLRSIFGMIWKLGTGRDRKPRRPGR